MNRRKALNQINLLATASLLTPTLFLQCTSDDYQPLFLSKSEYQLIESLSEFILPATDLSPGAREAQVTNFLDSYLANCQTEMQQVKFRDGLAKFELHCIESVHEGFKSLDESGKSKLLSLPTSTTILKNNNIQQLILLAYFTSQIGMKEALQYVAVPGKYQGSFTYQEGQGAWAL